MVWGQQGASSEAVRLRNSASVQNGPWYRRLFMSVYVSYLGFQERLIALTNPAALRLRAKVARSVESVEAYRVHNRAPMQLWMSVSLAPHAYLFAIFEAFDRLELYVLLRVSVMTSLSVAALVSQFRTTRRTTLVFQNRGWA